MHCSRGLVWSLVLLLPAGASNAETFRVATYNLEGYLLAATDSRPAKTEASKAKIRENILALKPDVLALQEIAGTNALLELQSSLKTAGLDLPYWELVSGFDTNIQVAVLTRFPITARRPHPREHFLLNGHRFGVSRGFLEVDIQVAPQYAFTLLTAHLKSKRPVFSADEAELRLEEAKLLREKIDAHLSTHPEANLVVLGDFNDSKDSSSTKAVLGRYRRKLVDTRPAERSGEPADAAPDARPVTWTHFYAKDDSYSRIDFLLLSPGMAREWLTNQTYVLAAPGWGVASDHRPIVAAFEAEDR